MGCKLSLPFLPRWSGWGLPSLETEADNEKAVDGVKQYSWDRLRVEVDLSQYIVDGQEGGQLGRQAAG